MNKADKNENRLEARLKEMQDKGKKALTVYLMGGDPDIELSAEIIINALRNGADIVEIGVPFSDPLADGPVIQRAALRSLANNINVDHIFEMVIAIRRESAAPLALMLYFNTIYRYGIQSFMERAAACGIDALIIPDLPFEEKKEVETFARPENIIIIDLITPETPANRLKNLLENARGFVYCVSLSGVTGVRKELAPGLKKMIDEARIHTDLPLFAGFGISSPQQAKDAANIADGVIVGSTLISELENNLSRRPDLPALIGAKVSALREAVDSF